jgi:hypothetical protein
MAVVQQPRKKPRRRKARSNGGMMSAPLLAVSHPRPFFRFLEATEHSVRVHGHEMLATTFCSSTTVRNGPFLINPAIANVFPRLAPLALSFEKYRFKSLRLIYTSAAPTTRSGQIALCIVSDVEAQAPGDIVEMYNYECSVVSPVGMGASTPRFRMSDPGKWYLTNAVTSFTSAVDPTNRFVGKIFALSTRSTSADSGTIAGEISIEYEVEFCNSRPSLAISTSTSNVDTITYTDAEQRSVWDRVISMIGWFGLEPKNTDPIQTGSVINLNEAYLLDIGKWMMNWVYSFAGVSFEVLRAVDRREQTHSVRHRYRPKGSRYAFACRRTTANCKPFGEDDDEKELPEAAGDITVALKCTPVDGGSTETVFETVYSSGTGVLDIDESLAIIVGQPCRFFWTVKLATGEERTVDPDNAFVSISVLDTDTSLFTA